LSNAAQIGVVVQTTQMLANLENIVEYLKTLNKNVHVHNTICKSTSMRQNEAKEIAKNSNLMIVVGSKKSANTTHLAEILKELTETLHIENEAEVFRYKDLIEKSQNIGVTAGASTPDYVINKVIEKIKEEIKL
jgi:4-hydroxy-3-methylbut-2-enyl diphosphate reductase